MLHPCLSTQDSLAVAVAMAAAVDTVAESTVAAAVLLGMSVEGNSAGHGFAGYIHFAAALAGLCSHLVAAALADWSSRRFVAALAGWSSPPDLEEV